MVSRAGSHDGEIASRETVELSFSTVKQEYVVQNQQGGSGGTITAGYDFQGEQRNLIAVFPARFIWPDLLF